MDLYKMKDVIVIAGSKAIERNCEREQIIYQADKRGESEMVPLCCWHHQIHLTELRARKLLCQESTLSF